MKKGIMILVSLMTVLGVVAQKSPSKFGMDTTYAMPQGLEVGIEAPLFKTTDIEGNKIKVSELLKSGPVVIVFYRGEWCPWCTKYLSELNESLPEIKAKGASVLVVSPEVKSSSENTKKMTASDFVFISDADLKIGKAYDVLFHVTEDYQGKVHAKLKKGDPSNTSVVDNLPVPATYVIGVDGKITYRQFDYNYSKRANAGDILEVL